MLLLLNQVLRFVFQPVITLKKQKYHDSVPLKKNDPNQFRAVPTNSKANDTKAKLVYFFYQNISRSKYYVCAERKYFLLVCAYLVIFITNHFSRLAAIRMVC